MPLHTYQAVQTGFISNFILPMLLGILLIGIAIYLNKKEVSYENRNLKNLFFLFSLFGILLAFGVALFSWFNMKRMQSVELYDTKLKIEQKMLDFRQIKRVYIHQDFQSSHISPQIIRDTTFLLIIEERTGKTYVLSEENYPIKEMVVEINEQMNQ